ncbi:MAG TPA: putative quinol monooxygenase [Rhizomicrobium sp.]
MGVGIVATVKIKEGTNEAFEAAARELMAAVRANEPGNTFYQFCRSKADPTIYVAMEIYADQAAVDAHLASDHFRTMGAKMGPSMTGRPEIQFFEPI